MNNEIEQHEIDAAKGDWLDALLHADANRLDLQHDASFTRSVLNTLPEQVAYRATDLARVLLSALASVVAGVVVLANGPRLLDNFTQALATLKPEQMVASAAPFAMLLGMALFTFRLQTTER